jgi:hypothetical protein
MRARAACSLGLSATKQYCHQQPVNSIFLSEQTSTSTNHQPPVKRTASALGHWQMDPFAGKSRKRRMENRRWGWGERYHVPSRSEGTESGSLVPVLQPDFSVPDSAPPRPRPCSPRPLFSSLRRFVPVRSNCGGGSRPATRWVLLLLLLILSVLSRIEAWWWLG